MHHSWSSLMTGVCLGLIIGGAVPPSLAGPPPVAESALTASQHRAAEQYLAFRTAIHESLCSEAFESSDFAYTLEGNLDDLRADPLLLFARSGAEMALTVHQVSEIALDPASFTEEELARHPAAFLILGEMSSTRTGMMTHLFGVVIAFDGDGARGVDRPSYFIPVRPVFYDAELPPDTVSQAATTTPDASPSVPVGLDHVIPICDCSVVRCTPDRPLSPEACAYYQSQCIPLQANYSNHIRDPQWQAYLDCLASGAAFGLAGGVLAACLMTVFVNPVAAAGCVGVAGVFFAIAAIMDDCRESTLAFREFIDSYEQKLQTIRIRACMEDFTPIDPSLP